MRRRGPVAPTDDLAPAQWLSGTDRAFGGRVDDLVPPGFPAYLRLFHRPDQGLPDCDGITSWRVLAERHGTVLHPEAQWSALTRGREETSPDVPLTGSLDRLTLPRLAGHLARHTGTPERCHPARWEGAGIAGDRWRGRPTFARPGRTYWLFPARPVEEVTVLARELERLSVEAAVRGRRARRRWRQALEEYGGGPSPSLWWPDDHAWVVHSETDHDSTVVAGSAALAADLLADPELECLLVPPDALLWANADRVNLPDS
jgi:hypothetical protein